MARQPLQIPRALWIGGLAAVALTASAAAEPQQPDADLECLVDVARSKGKLASADRQRADLAIMYYLGRMTARMNEVEVAERVARVPRPATVEEAEAVRRRCAANLMTTVVFMAPINKALAKAAE